MPTMPNLFGLDLQMAEQALQNAGVLVQSSIGYFGTWPISVHWVSPSSPQFFSSFTADSFITADSSIPVDVTAFTPTPGLVINQSLGAGESVAINSPLRLTVIQYPISVVYPGGYNSGWI